MISVAYTEGPRLAAQLIELESGEKEHIGQGVAFCANCDGLFYKNKKVTVIGGGNSGVEAAIDLAGIAREVDLFEFADKLKADEVLV